MKKLKFDQSLSLSEKLSILFRYGIYFLRGMKFLFYFKIPKMLFLGKHVKFRFPRRISIGKCCKFEDWVVLDGCGHYGLLIGDDVSIGAYSRLIVSTTYNNIGKFIKIGNRVGIAEYARIGGSGGVTIGDDTIIAQYFSAHPEEHIFDRIDIPIRLQGTKRKEIIIGYNCWIGARVTILSGVTIGDNSVIGAGSVVNTDIPENTIAVGMPAKVIKNR